MMEPMISQTRSKLAVVAVAAVALLGVAMPPAVADNIGAPTSAAGGVSTPSSPSRPGAVGPLGGTSGSSASGSGSSYDYEPLKLAPGTGKFEGPNNGTTTPCIGTTGFGGSSVQPGHKC
jgi:hypothetical protein